MTTLNDMEALGAEVVVEDGINGPHHYVVTPVRQPLPQHFQAPATRVVSKQSLHLPSRVHLLAAPLGLPVSHLLACSWALGSLMELLHPMFLSLATATWHHQARLHR